MGMLRVSKYRAVRAFADQGGGEIALAVVQRTPELRQLVAVELLIRLELLFEAQQAGS
jgi:hypothetical protein